MEGKTLQFAFGVTCVALKTDHMAISFFYPRQKVAILYCFNCKLFFVKVDLTHFCTITHSDLGYLFVCFPTSSTVCCDVRAWGPDEASIELTGDTFKDERVSDHPLSMQ